MMAELDPWLARSIVGILYLKFFLVGAARSDGTGVGRVELDLVVLG